MVNNFSQLIAIFWPIVLVGYWVMWSRCSANRPVMFHGLFFVSFVAFSSNSELIYREVHQAIQITIFVGWLAYLTRAKKLDKIALVFVPLLFWVALSGLANEIDSSFLRASLNLSVVLTITIILLSYSFKNLDRALVFLVNISVLTGVVATLDSVISGGRITVTMANPNYLGFVLAIAFAINQSIGRTKKHSTFTSFVLLLGIFVTGSRAAYAMVFLIATLMFSKPLIKRMSALTLTLSTGIILIFFFWGVTFLNIGIDGSVAERRILADVAVSMFREHPFIGVGWGRFVEEFEGYVSSSQRIVLGSGEIIDMSNQVRRVTHNDFIRVTVELGPLGFLAAMYSLFFVTHASAKYVDSEYSWVFPAIVATLSFSITHNNLNSVLFWFVLIFPYFLNKKEGRM